MRTAAQQPPDEVLAGNARNERPPAAPPSKNNIAFVSVNMRIFFRSPGSPHHPQKPPDEAMIFAQWQPSD